MKKRERCWSLGKTFQCIPESATNIRWNDLGRQWEYKSISVKKWKPAPQIGKDKGRYKYPSTFKSPVTRQKFKQSITIGFLFLISGIMWLYYNEMRNVYLEDITASYSDWMIGSIFIFLIVYMILFLTYRIWNREKYTLE